MPNEQKKPANDTGPQESFLKTSSSGDSTNPYGDFFSETPESIYTPTRHKHWLEVLTGIFGFIIPIAIILVILGSTHVFIRTQESNTFAQNYSFLCPYLNMGVDIANKECKTLKMIENEYTEQSKKLKEEMIVQLSEYIPIKISKNIIEASPEKKFISKMYNNKIYIDEIMRQFEKVRTSATYKDTNNIECKGISITNGDTMTTQCTIFGGKIGADDIDNQFGSARIEALSFLDELANTSKSQFILLNPPNSLNVEILKGGEDTINPLFETRTTIQIQVRYVSFNKKS